MKNICKVKDCESRCEGLGYCSKHYQRFRRHADHRVVKKRGSIITPFQRFKNKVKVNKETGKPIKEPTPKEVGGITEQDLITEMGTWDKDKIKAFQKVAKEAGLYKGEINGLHSNELDNAMKEYYKGHKEEWE